MKVKLEHACGHTRGRNFTWMKNKPHPKDLVVNSPCISCCDKYLYLPKTDDVYGDYEWILKEDVYDRRRTKGKD